MLINNFQQIIMDFPVGGEYLMTGNIRISPFKVGNLTSCILYNKRAGSDDPRAQIGFNTCFESPGSHIAHLGSCSAQQA